MSTKKRRYRVDKEEENEDIEYESKCEPPTKKQKIDESQEIKNEFDFDPNKYIKFDKNKNKKYVVKDSNMLNKVIKKSMSGDQILLKKGIYGDVDIIPCINKNIQFIGMDKNVIITASEEYYKKFACLVMGNSDKKNDINIYFENITFKINSSQTKNGGIYVGQHCILWLKDCKINFEGNGIVIRETASCNIKDCEFIGGWSGIEASPLAININVMRCTFKKCKNPCINIKDSFDDLGGHIADKGWYSIQETRKQQKKIEEDTHGFTLKCIDNVFVKGKHFPIAITGIGYDFYQIENFKNNHIFKDNILKQMNKKKKKDLGVDDANKLYQNIQKITFL